MKVSRAADTLALARPAAEVTALAAAAGFEVVQTYCDRRLLVNRGRQLKMYRCAADGLASFFF